MGKAVSGGADLLRSVPPEPTQSKPERPAARRVWEGRARWRRCLSVTDRCGSAPSSRLANRTLLSQTEPLPIFRQALSQNDSVGRPGTAQQILLQDEARAKRRPIDARNQRTATHSRKKAQPVRPIQLHRWLCIPQAASQAGRCLRQRHVCGTGPLGDRSLPQRRFEGGTWSLATGWPRPGELWG